MKMMHSRKKHRKIKHGSDFLQGKLPEKNNNNTILNNINSEIISMIAQEKLSIYLTTINNSSISVDDIYELLNDVTNYYLEFQKKRKRLF
jgi:hypothetical protein